MQKQTFKLSRRLQLLEKCPAPVPAPRYELRRTVRARFKQ